jgi:hypothetical protein
VLEVRLGGDHTTFAAWRTAAFPNPEDLANPLISGPGADPQGAGCPNLLRYALGLALEDDPATRAPRFAGSAAAPAIELPFDPGRNDIAYIVEAADNIADWEASTILFDSRTDFPPPATLGWITISDTAFPGAQRFYRLRVLWLNGG